MTYLVTGGSGFIGSHLVEGLLKQGHNVINIDNFDDFYDYRIKVINTLDSLRSNINFAFVNKAEDLEMLPKQCNSANYKLYVEDIRNFETLKKICCNYRIDTVIHLAALAGVRPSIERPAEYLEVNVRGTQNILEVCRQLNIKNFICASSSSVYGNNEKVPFAETDVVDFPISPYAATKKSAELIGHVYYKLYQISQIHLRFFTVYGPRQRPDLAIHKFTELISKNRELPFYGDGSTSRDYTYISDIVAGILQAIEILQSSPPRYEIVNLGGNKVVTLEEMLNEIEKNLQQKARRKNLPVQAGDVTKTWADLTHAQQLLNYHPTTSFQNGIKIFMEWFLRKKI